jgi:hypothetical protein
MLQLLPCANTHQNDQQIVVYIEAMMKQLMQKFMSHKKTFVFLICAFLFVILQADECMAGPAATKMLIGNQSSVTIKAMILCGDESPTVLLAPGENTTITVGGGNTMNYTFVARPMEDWLTFAKDQRDQLISQLAKAKETGKAADIKAITEKLSVVKARINRLEEQGVRASCSGVANGNSVGINVFDGQETYSLRARCSNSLE